MTKSRKSKLFFIGILAILYIVISLNFHKIRFALSILRLYGQDKKIESTIDDKANNEPIVDNPLKDILESVGVMDNSKDIEDTNKENKKSSNKINISDDRKKDYINIIDRYNSTFEDLQSEFESQLNSLVKKGIAEYSNGGVSTTKLANKYLSIGADLEKSSDAKFNKILKEMEKELKSNGHDTSITKEIKNYYTSFKDAKKTDLIDRGMKHVD
ncbi:hypothetical protein [Tissierella pigra]|uniref:Uncharacterized protein n=1 Tax=Tissierella pigra TaxID=2607614 RepID=A0A6N7XHP7_9FIRM|nr:hypothetical protein [Tissierella pigra]MSU00252.1 hypothetical protein [Tissierella pigra]